MAGKSGTPQLESDNPFWTRPVIQNNTENELKWFDQRNRSGTGPAPGKIEATRTNEFKHFSEGEGSYGGVAYQIVNGCKWIVVWKNLLNVNNKVYTKILDSGKAIHWEEIFDKIDGATNKSIDNNGELAATVVIDQTGGRPTATAVLESSSK